MSATPCGKGTATVLVVEDDPDFAEIVTTALESAAFTVVTAANKDEGLALARGRRPDCIVLDVMMPAGTEGFHFVWELRKDAEQEVRETPILILTAIHGQTGLRFYPDQSDATYGPNEYLPVQEFLDKPVDPVKLVEVVKSLVARGRERQRTTLRQ
ncbi:MAG: response regulator [Armatimonadetes bacterium]|nr:response regulator [Armatimonadota bacterium]